MFYKRLPNYLPICIPTSKEWERVPVASSLPDFGHSNKYVVVSHWCFDLHFPDIWCRTSFHMLFAICVFSLMRCLLRLWTCILIGLFSCWLLRILYIFWIKILHKLTILLKIFSASLCLFPNSLDIVFYRPIFFN